MASTRTIVSVLAVGLLSAGAVGYGYFNDKWQHEPFPADEYVVRVLTTARGMAPDAQVVGLAANFVDEMGLVHSSFPRDGYYEPGGHLEMTFHSASHTSGGGPAPEMLGAPASSEPALRCPTLLVAARLQGNKARSLTIEGNWRGGDCRAWFPEPVHCTVAQIWQRAVAAGAPHTALADIDLGPANSHTGRAWRFQIIDRSSQSVVFTKGFADDC
jgi:hypothetical protein